jgi:hypothetical protein
VIAGYKRSSLSGLIISNEGKKFYNIDSNALGEIWCIYVAQKILILEIKQASFKENGRYLNFLKNLKTFHQRPVL